MSSIIQRKYTSAGYNGNVTIEKIWIGDADKNFIILKANNSIT